MNRIALTRAALGCGTASAFAAGTPADGVKTLQAEPHPNHAAVDTERLQGPFDAEARQAEGAVGDLGEQSDGERIDDARSLGKPRWQLSTTLRAAVR